MMDLYIRLNMDRNLIRQLQQCFSVHISGQTTNSLHTNSAGHITKLNTFLDGVIFKKPEKKPTEECISGSRRVHRLDICQWIDIIRSAGILQKTAVFVQFDNYMLKKHAQSFGRLLYSCSSGYF